MRKQLEEQINAAKRLKYPNVPTSAIPKTKLKDGNANELTNSIIEVILFKEGWATRINSAGIWDANKKTHRTSTTEKGTADVHGCFSGRHLSIEVKFGNDRMSPDQHTMMHKITDAGGWYCIARSIDQFISDFFHEFSIS